FVAGFEVGEDFRQVRSGKTAQNLPELRKIALFNQLDQFRLEQASNHSRQSTSRSLTEQRKKVPAAPPIHVPSTPQCTKVRPLTDRMSWFHDRLLLSNTMPHS